MTTLLIFSAILFLSWYIISSIITWYKLRQFPGPFLSKFSYLWHIYHELAGDMGPAHLELNKYDSPLVRTGPHYLVTTDPNIFRHVNGARSIYPRDDWWAATRLDWERPALADTTDTASHDQMKAKVMVGYSGRDVDLERIVDEQIAKFADVMRSKHVPRNKVDFADLSRFFTLDVITRIAYGKEFGWVEADKDLYGYSAQVNGFASLASLMADVKWLHPIARSSFLNSRFKPRPTDRDGVGKVVGYVTAWDFFIRIIPLNDFTVFVFIIELTAHDKTDLDGKKSKDASRKTKKMTETWLDLSFAMD